MTKLLIAVGGLSLTMITMSIALRHAFPLHYITLPRNPRESMCDRKRHARSMYFKRSAVERGFEERGKVFGRVLSYLESPELDRTGAALNL